MRLRGLLGQHGHLRAQRLAAGGHCVTLHLHRLVDQGAVVAGIGGELLGFGEIRSADLFR